MYSSLPDEPVSVLDPTSLAFRFWRRNMMPICRLLLAPSICVTISAIGLQWVISHGATMVNSSNSFGLGLAMFVLFVVDITAWSVAWWWLTLRLMALVRFSLGYSNSLEDARQFIMARKWSVILVSVLLYISIVTVITVFGGVGIAAFAIGPALKAYYLLVIGAFAMLAIIPLFCLYLILSHISLCILACESDNVLVTFRKSFQLLFGNFWRVCLFSLLFCIIFFAAYYPFSLPVGICTMIDYYRHGVFSGGERASSYNPSVYLLVITSFWESFIGLLLRPLVLIGWGYFYYDLRMRSEGIDLRRKLAEIEGTQGR